MSLLLCYCHCMITTRYFIFLMDLVNQFCIISPFTRSDDAYALYIYQRWRVTSRRVRTVRSESQEKVHCWTMQRVSATSQKTSSTSLLCNTELLVIPHSLTSDTKFQAMRRTPSPDNTRGITISAAKFSSEDAATLVQYTIAIIEFTRLCTPLRSALDRQHQLEREIEENERIAREKANKVLIIASHTESTP